MVKTNFNFVISLLPESCVNPSKWFWSDFHWQPNFLSGQGYSCQGANTLKLATEVFANDSPEVYWHFYINNNQGNSASVLFNHILFAKCLGHYFIFCPSSCHMCQAPNIPQCNSCIFIQIMWFQSKHWPSNELHTLHIAMSSNSYIWIPHVESQSNLQFTYGTWVMKLPRPFNLLI